MYHLMKGRSARLMLGFALGLGAASPWVGAKEDAVELDKVPKHIRAEIDKGTKGGSHIKVILVTEEGERSQDYYVRYESGDGKDMKMRIAPNGKVLEHGETRDQRHKDEEGRLAQAKTDAERAQIQAQLAAEREAEDKAQFQAAQAAAQAQAQAAAAQAQAAAAAAAARHAPPPPPPPAPSYASLSLKDLSEEYNSTDRQSIAYAVLPPGAKKTFDMETIGTTHVDYFKYTAGGRLFYSAHYDTGADRRVVCRVDDTGKLLGKNDLVGPADFADEAASELHKK
jgi:hypothetical protein